jgi:hypothetical protein
MICWRGDEADAELRATAWHEAAHAVAAAVQGVVVHEVTVVPGENRFGGRTLGHCRAHKQGDARADHEVNAIIYLAGPAVERRGAHPRWFNRKVHPRFWRGDDWGGAYHHAQRAADTVHGEASPAQVGAYLKMLFAWTRTLLAHEPHWDAVAMVGRRLVREGTLGDAAVRQALGAARGHCRVQTARRLRELGVIKEYTLVGKELPLEHLLRALEDVRSGRRLARAVAKELDKEFWDRRWQIEWEELRASQAAAARS